mgnify:FL=1
MLQLNGVTLGKIDASVSHAFSVNGRLQMSNLLVFQPDAATHSDGETRAEADGGHAVGLTPASTQAISTQPFPGMIVLEIRSERL